MRSFGKNLQNRSYGTSIHNTYPESLKLSNHFPTIHFRDNIENFEGPGGDIEYG